MKIALLNLPFDNNYGGNLQRYALMHTLEALGHDVTHLNLRAWYKKTTIIEKAILIIKYCILKITRRQINWNLYQRMFPFADYQEKCSTVEPFHTKYVKHTEPIYSTEDLVQFKDFDCFLVGSDQVWSKSMAKKYLPTMFFSYLPDKAKRVAYSVSLGKDTNELTDDEIKLYAELYKKFDAVSVREKSALSLFKQYGWDSPEAIQTLDPTLLLDKDVYNNLIEHAETSKPSGNAFCYILDYNPQKQECIDKLCSSKNLTPFVFSIDRKSGNHSIEQWLRSFRDADYIVTDSYHGFLFSIIYNKPFHLFQNEKRGNARFDSVCESLGIDANSDQQDWAKVNRKLKTMREVNISYLMKALQ